jgi:hypothetical protein
VVGPPTPSGTATSHLFFEIVDPSKPQMVDGEAGDDRHRPFKKERWQLILEVPGNRNL